MIELESGEKTVSIISTTLKSSFMASYIVLMGYTTITVVEALRTNNANVRHIMNIETAVSLIAGLVYSVFNEEIKKPTVDLHDITRLRYVDWMITTPLILLVILLFYSPNAHPSFQTYLYIIILNWLMLGSGYLGEQGFIGRISGLIGGFIFLILMLATIYTCCVPANSSHVVFYIFAILWSLYGVAYMLDEETKNLMYNVLDVLSKAVFGVILYMYYGKVLAF